MLVTPEWQEQKNKYFNLGYCATIIAFYLTPFLIVKDNIFRSLKNKILNKNFYFIIFYITLYFNIRFKFF